MPEIEGNFNPKLEILWTGQGVTARGPIKWGKDDMGAMLHVAIMQEEAAATGHTGDDVPPTANEFLLAAAVQGDGTLKAGPAIATGLALVRGDGVEMYQWSASVELTDNGAAAPAPKSSSTPK